MYDVIIIGAGAAGMMAGVICAKAGLKTLLVEKNEKPGKKLYITGKGRCNITNDCDANKLTEAVVKNPKFLYSAFSRFNNKDMINFLTTNGLDITVEQGDRVFPKSGKSSDVIKFFQRLLNKYGAEIMLDCEVENICVKEASVCGIYVKNGVQINCRNIILATGGASYPLTGSTGDGYKFARELGLVIIKPYPALTAMEAERESIFDLCGLALKNVKATIYKDQKKVASKLGEILFTHDGLSGPVILALSALISEYRNIFLEIDLKPALEHEKLDARILRDFSKLSNKEIKNALTELLPQRLIKPVLRLSQIKYDKKVNQVSAEERKRLVDTLKAMPFYIKRGKGFEEAIITGGGIAVSEIQPSSMESKKINGLYFAGEVIDTHAITGGYNLQIAFSTAQLSANSIIKSIEKINV